MASITSWNRLEPLPSTADLEAALEARTADPLWLLARQWQVLEFAGEDSGTPVIARITARESSLGGVRLGRADGDAVAIDDRGAPLETVIEAEPVAPDDHERLRVETGMQLIRMLTADNRADAGQAFLDAYRFAPADDAVGRRGTTFRTIASGRAPDGAAVAAALRSRLDGDGTLTSLPPEVDVPDSIEAAVTVVAAAWLRWYEGLVDSGSGAAWDTARLEYTAATAARTDDGTDVLAIDEFSEGHLDWYAFNRRPADVGDTVDPGESVPETITRTVIPVPASYAGMPADRFWEFENARVNLGAVDAGPADITRLALVEFALVYGNDWFVLPLDLRCGSLCTISGLEVVDTFGETTEIPPVAADDGWAMFELGARDLPSRLLVPPVLAESLSGEPIESVTFVRDEMANMAWAVERTVSDATGEVFDRTETPVDEATGWQHVGDGTPEGVDAYRLATPVPDHWIPLVPVRADADDASVVLEKRTIRRSTPEGSVDVEPLGRILEPGAPLRIAEETVPRSGVTVERAWQLARWVDGSTHLWVGRRRRAGRGPAHSGLRFDIVDAPPR